MPNRIVICEKSSQAKHIRAAIGNRHGPVLPAQGHIVQLAEPEEVREEWKTWGTDLLWPDGFYPKKESPPTKRLLDAIRNAARNADEVVIATDCDREGQLIGDEILDHIGFRGKRWRAIFNAEDPKTLQTAFDNLRPNSDFAGLYAAGQAREQADQTINLSLTRAATVVMKTGGKGAIGIGRVKTPVLGIVCRRELEIENFTPQDMYEIDALVKTGEEEVVLTCARLPESLLQQEDGPEQEDGDEDPDPDGEEEALEAAQPLRGRILDPRQAQALADAAQGFRGNISSKATQKKQRPPKLFDLTALQAATSARFGWSGDKTLDIAQALYSEKTLITYPRAEAQYLPEANIEDVRTLLPALLTVPSYAKHGELLAKPVIRKGKSGHFSDAALEGLSHYAIIPNVNVADTFPTALPRLSEDERNLFDMIASRYLAALAPDHEYLQLDLVMPFPWNGHEWLFRSTGRTPVLPGWTAILRPAREKDAPPDLPKIPDGASGEILSATLRTVTTRPPARYSEGSLIKVMKEAWRLVEHPERRARLKEARGIGTPATRSDVVKGLLSQTLLLRKGKTLQPSDAGMAVYQAVLAAAPNVVDVARTALWEMLFDMVERGTLPPQAAVERLLKEARTEIARIEQTNVRIDLGAGAKPTAKMAEAARNLAQRKGITLPRGTLSNAAACRAFLDEHMPKAQLNEAGERMPSDSQLALAERLANEGGIPVPEEARTSASALSTWIDQRMKAAPPSESQLNLARKLSEEHATPVPDEALASRKLLSEWIDSLNSGKSKVKGGHPRSKGGRRR